MKRSFFQAAVVSILLYGCTTWTLTKRMEKKLDIVMLEPFDYVQINELSSVELLVLNNFGGSCGVMVIVVGNGHGDTSLNPGRDWLHFI